MTSITGHVDKSIQDCIRLCAECADSCLQTSMHCLNLGGEHADARHQTLLHDCADICAAAARFMSRNSPHHPHLCGECAEICEQCAEDCERMARGDAVMEHCAQACRRCAASCRRMADAH